MPRVIALRNWSVHYRPQSYSQDEPDLRAKVEEARARIADNALMATTTACPPSWLYQAGAGRPPPFRPTPCVAGRGGE